MSSATTAVLHEVRPQAVYSLEAARNALGLAKATLRREVRLGRLRVAKRAGRYYLLGSWVLQWLRDGEVRRRARSVGGPPEPGPRLVASAS